MMYQELTMSGEGSQSKKDFPKEEPGTEEIKVVIAYQLAMAMKKKKMSKSRMASMLKTSRAQVDRLLDPNKDITIASLQRAAAVLGLRVLFELI